MQLDIWNTSKYLDYLLVYMIITFCLYFSYLAGFLVLIKVMGFLDLRIYYKYAFKPKIVFSFDLINKDLWLLGE